MARISGLTSWEIVRPLRTTFSTSRGRKQNIRNIIVQVRLDDGRVGKGEIPTSFTYPDETIEEIRTVLTTARAELKGLPIEGHGQWADTFRSRVPHAMMTVSGLEVALFRAFLAHESISEYVCWGGKGTIIETDITIPMLADKELLERWVNGAIRRGFTTYKLKVGGDDERDRALVSSVYAILDAGVDGFRLRLDGNQGYTVDSFLDFLTYLEKERYRIELFEQPLGKDDFRGLEELRGKSGVPIILDEGVRNIDHAKTVIDNDLCVGINIKIAKSGIEGSRKIAELARKHGKKLMIGCMTETMVGLSAGILMALGRGDMDYVDLDAAYLLYGNPKYTGLSLKGPLISIA